MTLGIINSAFDQAGVDTLSGLEHIARIGFDSVDIFTEASTITESQVQLIESACERLLLPIISLPVVACGLIDFNAPVRDFHIRRVQKFVDLASRFRAQNVLLVLGEYIWQREVIPPADQWAWGVESVRQIGHYAAEQGISLALELEPFRLSLLNSLPSMVRFLEDVALPNVLANIDISHLVLSDTSPGDLHLLRGKAAHVHISDCDGKVHGDLPPGRGIVKFVPYLQAIKDLEFAGTISLELEYPPDPSQVVAWVEEAYQSTARLFDLLDLRSPRPSRL